MNLAFAINGLLIFSSGIYLMAYPSFMWPVGKFTYIVALIFILISLAFKKARVKKPILFFLIIFLYFFIELMEGSSLAGATLFSIILAVVLIKDDDFLLRSFSQFKSMIVAVSLLGLFFWFTQIIFGFDFLLLGYVPDSIVPNQLKIEYNTKYAIYPFSTGLVHHGQLVFYRFQGVFDEPGYLGTLVALLFAASGFKFNGWVNKGLVIVGFASLSLSFYILFTLSLFLFYARKPLLLIKVATIFITLGLAFISTDYGYKIFESKIVDRLKVVEGGISGDNRSTVKLDQAFHYIIKQAPLEDKLFGLDGFTNDGSASFKQVVVQIGFVGLLAIVFLYLMLTVYFNSKIQYKSLVFILIFSVSFLQRPDVVNPLFLYVFIIGVLYPASSLNRKVS